MEVHVIYKYDDPHTSLEPTNHSHPLPFPTHDHGSIDIRPFCRYATPLSHTDCPQYAYEAAFNARPRSIRETTISISASKGIIKRPLEFGLPHVPLRAHEQPGEMKQYAGRHLMVTSLTDICLNSSDHGIMKCKRSMYLPVVLVKSTRFTAKRYKT